MYAVYHGPDGLRRIARRVHGFTVKVANIARDLGYTVLNPSFFDTISLRLPPGVTDAVVRRATQTRRINLRHVEEGVIALSLDETV
ncbi:MAG: hypothetical protein KDB87_00715, partial [Flavobacteriales bacterium]|nr:hypothetical protein [Flavobacteriales bacterium]